MITPKENYLMMLRGEIPEYIPSIFEPYQEVIELDPGLLTPVFIPNGPQFSPWGVRFVGSADNNFGAIPEPNNFILKDITKWREVIKNPDVSDVDWENMIRKKRESEDPRKVISFAGGDYFQSLVSFMGFTEALIAMYEEPEAVKALMEYLSEYYIYVLKQELYYGKPDTYIVVDDCAAAKAPFFSSEMYKELIKPYHKKHAELASDCGALLERHDCGRSEVFIQDWLEIGIRAWNPAQIFNDLKSIKTKYLHKLALCGCWDNQGIISRPETPDEVLTEALREYVDTYAPGGGFVFMANITGNMKDERVKRKQELVKKFYYDYAKDFYRTH